MITIDAVQIDEDIERGAEGGPEFSTIIVTAASGAEYADQRWSHPRRKWNIAYGIQSNSDLQSIVAFFKARAGRARGFLFKDWMDYTLTDENIGTGNSTDGTDGTAAFQITKLYTDAVNPYTRNITRPNATGFVVKVDGTTKTLTTHYTINTTTGVITFTAGNRPLAGQAITVTGEFFVPVRFDTDFLEISAEWAQAGSLPDIDIIELKE